MTRNSAEEAQELILSAASARVMLLDLIAKLSAFTDILEAEAAALPGVRQGEAADGDRKQ